MRRERELDVWENLCTTLKKLEAKKDQLEYDLAYPTHKFECFPFSQRDEEELRQLTFEMYSLQVDIDFLLGEATKSAGG